jgi:hypothetical protein
MSAKNQFEWIPFYEEFADKLLVYKDNRQGLIEKIKQVYEVTGIKLPTIDRDKEGNNILVDIDPFTVFGLFNKHEVKEDGTPVETSDYLVVGSGSSDTARENCFAAGKNSADGKYITVGNTKLTEQALINLIDLIQPFTITGDIIDGDTITLPYTGNELNNHLNFTIRWQQTEEFCYVLKIFAYYNNSDEVQIRFDSSSYADDGGSAILLHGYSSSNQFTVEAVSEV